MIKITILKNQGNFSTTQDYKVNNDQDQYEKDQGKFNITILGTPSLR